MFRNEARSVQWARLAEYFEAPPSDKDVDYGTLKLITHNIIVKCTSLCVALQQVRFQKICGCHTKSGIVV